MEKIVKASAWMEPTRESEFSFRLQIDNISARSFKKIEKVCANWRHAGYGWNPDTNYKILMFIKEFNNRGEWIEWAKQFPFKLVELNSKGNPKPIKLGIDFLNKKRKKRK
jgi:hypothetical protein